MNVVVEVEPAPDDLSNRDADQRRARARVANADERRRLWVEFTNVWPNYDRYQAQTARQIPLVILSPSPQKK